MTLPARIEAKIDRDGPGGCWLWTAAKAGRGYGVTNWDRRQQYAHRVVYELLVGPIPEGLTIDHVWARGCRHLNCVNPAHLEAVTQRENNARGNSPTAINARRTHCIHGHLIDGRRPNGQRYCVTCDKHRRGGPSGRHLPGACDGCGGRTSGRNRTRCVECWQLLLTVTADIVVGAWEDDWTVPEISAVIGRSTRSVRQIVQRERDSGRAVSFRHQPRKPLAHPRARVENVVPLRPEPPAAA